MKKKAKRSHNGENLQAFFQEKLLKQAPLSKQDNNFSQNNVGMVCPDECR